jgi:hypothetical protein
MARPRKYETVEEKIKAYKTQCNNYAKKNWKCTVCDCNLQIGNKSTHFKSKKHRKNLT